MAVPVVHPAFRALHASLLPSTCALQSVHGTTGARTTVATVVCGTQDPTAQETADWMGDERLVAIALPYAALDGIAAPDVVVVDGATAFRVRQIQPKTSFAAGRRLLAVESREPGGPV